MNAIELFSCAGGMAEGFRRSGLSFAMAFDADPDACDSYEANMGSRPVQIDVRDLLRLVLSGWSPGQLHLIVADPPCTPWSRAGKRNGLDDERDMLRVTVDLIAALRPQAYMIGNVPGLQDAAHLPILRSLLQPLRKIGYCTADFAELDAADYGVPQRRVRPFWFGHLNGDCIRWPLPTHGPPHPNTQIPGVSLQPWMTCAEALGHLPMGELGRAVKLRWKEYDAAHGGHKPSDPDLPARTLTGNSHGDGTIIASRNHPPSRPDQPGNTVRASRTNGGSACAMLVCRRHPPSEADRPSMTVSAARPLGGNRGILRWPWTTPATTVCAETNKLAPRGRSGSAGDSQAGHQDAVVLSEKAAAILQGFPSHWVFCGKTKASRQSQIGQAMPPPLAEAVARSVLHQLERSKVVVA